MLLNLTWHGLLNIGSEIIEQLTTGWERFSFWCRIQLPKLANKIVIFHFKTCQNPSYSGHSKQEHFFGIKINLPASHGLPRWFFLLDKTRKCVSTVELSKLIGSIQVIFQNNLKSIFSGHIFWVCLHLICLGQSYTFTAKILPQTTVRTDCEIVFQKTVLTKLSTCL